jgi:NTP pyrophosphatase (non-canonical NTP hydrolase)
MTQAEFFAIADRILDDNSRTKSGWENENPSWHLRRLRQEVNELANAVALKKNPSEIQREAADVANFAYFIASVYTDDYEEAQALEKLERS